MGSNTVTSIPTTTIEINIILKITSANKPSMVVAGANTPKEKNVEEDKNSRAAIS